MKVTDLDLSKMLKFEPEKGQLKLGDERMLLFRMEAFGSLRKLLFEQLGDQLSRALLTQFGYRCGVGDYESLTTSYEWDTEQDRIACGPVLHTWEGIVHVEPTGLEFDRDKGSFNMTGIWRQSYEAALHLKEIGQDDFPVCHSLTGYASGWCTAFFGKPCVAIETKCVGKGDDRCEFEIHNADAWDERADRDKQSLSATSGSIVSDLEDKLLTIEEQAEAIRELSTPVLEVWDDVLVLPVVGIVDTRRSMDIMNTLLDRISETQAACVIIDVTGVEVVDTKTADYLLKVSRAASLLGTRCVLTGLSPAVAQTLVEIGADMTEIITLRSLKEGLRHSIRYIEENKLRESTFG